MNDDQCETASKNKPLLRNRENITPIIIIKQEWVARDAKWSAELAALITIFSVGFLLALHAVV